ncbi:phospholipase A2 inhibitor subunit gamma B-like [Xenopus tropicalis]|uniref:Phospholipase A2 inhibitor subunit gamma B-like n=1 Tax=Xenopus tropicalis TaxID=8364 RepID=A0A803KDW5_XENTR|nr:phospholipase A2 inhibitor subunit gamma B-like [Xenopus tropicalis]
MWIPGNLLTMRSAVGLLCVLSALLPTGHSLTCVSCAAFGSMSCRGNSTECPPGKVCGSLFIRLTAEQMGVLRSCAQESYCDKSGTFSVEESKGKETVTCCDTDNCTPPAPMWSDTRDTRPNGLNCPSCYSFSDGCSDPDQVSCSGNENYCLSQSIQLSGRGPGFSSFTLYGCATENLCQVGNNSLNSDVKIHSTVQCAKANGGDATTPGLTTATAVATATMSSGNNGSNAGHSGTSSLRCLFVCLAAVLLSAINLLS